MAVNTGDSAAGNYSLLGALDDSLRGLDGKFL